VHDRLFPLYSYRADDVTDSTSFSALWMFWRTTSPTISQTSLFPIASMATDKTTGETTWSFIGLEPAIPISWVRHTWTSEGSSGFFFPLYDYRSDESQSVLSIGGVSQLAIYRQEETPSYRSHRLFPIYSYQHDFTEDVTQRRILLVYEHEQSPIHSADHLFPLWQYERWDDQSETRLTALGFGSLSLYEHHTKPTGTTDRFFPLYEYVSNRDRDETEFSLLWPLADYKSRHGTVTSASLLWWLASYEHPDADHSSFHLFGGSKMAMVRRTRTPQESVFELNPVIPLYRYRHATDGNSSWDIFGGVLGMDTTPKGTRVKVLFVSL
jgi:hypothetical protein